MKIGQRTKYFLILAIGVFSLFFSPHLNGDDAGSPYSSQPDSNLGAWYDDTWEAVGFYVTFIEGSNCRYIFTADPTLISAGKVIVTPGSAQTEGTTGSAGAPSHTHTYRDRTGVSLDPDLVATEWHVTGHVHFTSGL